MHRKNSPILGIPKHKWVEAIGERIMDDTDFGNCAGYSPETLLKIKKLIKIGLNEYYPSLLLEEFIGGEIIETDYFENLDD